MVKEGNYLLSQLHLFFSHRRIFQSGAVKYSLKCNAFKDHFDEHFAHFFFFFFDAIKDVYKGLNGFPTYFSLQYQR